MSATDRAFVSQVIAALDKVGATPPPAVTKSWQATQRISAQIREIGVRPETVYAAIASALERGDDPALDAEVQRILIASQLSNQGVMTGVDDIAYSWLRQTCAENADGIIAAFAKPFDQAAKTLNDAHRAFGNIDITDADTVLRKGGNAASQWAQATAAGATIDTITQGWTMLAMFAGAPANRRYQVLRMAAVDYGTWQDHQLADRVMSPWGVLLAGLTLSLPTFTAYRERVATIVQGAEQEAQPPIDLQRSKIAGREILAVRLR